jgi:hypothetical protein
MGNATRSNGECSDEGRNVAVLGLIEPTLPLANKARPFAPAYKTKQIAIGTEIAGPDFVPMALT